MGAVMKSNEYVERRGEGWFVAGSRVSLDSVVSAFHDGLSPEAIARECFPTLGLAQVYGAITFYLSNRAEIDSYLQTWKAKGDAWRREIQASEADFSQKMAQVRRELLRTAS
jgi:uncharacterized protein (DUF433 family)